VEKPGNQVRVAYDGQEAVEVASVFQPDIVFMDLAMPKLDGYGAARHIRKQPWGQQMVLVAVSGWGRTGTKNAPRRPDSIIIWSSPQMRHS
jgi:CheY-like chemotaxis protein